MRKHVVAPIPAVRRAAMEPPESTLRGHSDSHSGTALPAPKLTSTATPTTGWVGWRTVVPWFAYYVMLCFLSVPSSISGEAASGGQFSISRPCGSVRSDALRPSAPTTVVISKNRDRNPPPNRSSPSAMTRCASPPADVSQTGNQRAIGEQKIGIGLRCPSQIFYRDR